LGSRITGDRKRKNGILQNRIYIGKIVHERTSKVAEPTNPKGKDQTQCGRGTD
tara:strand:- start:742 stop:900 length:159 start_codon:yes stop_codon:yes gene_type:complete